MEHDILFGNFNRENGPTFLDFPLFLGIFQWDEPTKRVPFTAEPEIPEILTKWKAPKILRSVSESLQYRRQLRDPQSSIIWRLIGLINHSTKIKLRCRQLSL